MNGGDESITVAYRNAKSFSRQFARNTSVTRPAEAVIHARNVARGAYAANVGATVPNFVTGEVDPDWSTFKERTSTHDVVKLVTGSHVGPSGD